MKNHTPKYKDSPPYHMFSYTFHVLYLSYKFQKSYAIEKIGLFLPAICLDMIEGDYTAELAIMKPIF